MVLQWFIASGPIIDISLQQQMDALSSAESQFFYPSQSDLKKKNEKNEDNRVERICTFWFKQLLVIF